MEVYPSYQDHAYLHGDSYEVVHSDYSERFYQQMAPYQQTYGRPGCDYRDFLSMPYADRRYLSSTEPDFHLRRPLHALQREEDFLGIPGPASRELDHFSLSRRRMSARRTSLPVRDQPSHPPYGAFNEERAIPHVFEHSGWPADDWDWEDYRRGYDQVDKWTGRETEYCKADSASAERQSDEESIQGAFGKENRAADSRHSSRIKEPPCKSDLDLHWRNTTKKPRDRKETVRSETTTRSSSVQSSWKYGRRSAGHWEGRSGRDPAWREGPVSPPSTVSWCRPDVRRKEWYPTVSIRKSSKQKCSAEKPSSAKRRRAKSGAAKSSKLGIIPEKGNFVCEGEETVPEFRSALCSQEEDGGPALTRQDGGSAQAKVPKAKKARSRRRRSDKKEKPKQVQENEQTRRKQEDNVEEEDETTTVSMASDKQASVPTNFREAIEVIENRCGSTETSATEAELSFQAVTPADTDCYDADVLNSTSVPSNVEPQSLNAFLFSPIPEESSLNECSANEESTSETPKMERCDGKNTPITLLKCLDTLAQEINIKVIIDDGFPLCREDTSYLDSERNQISGSSHSPSDRDLLLSVKKIDDVAQEEMKSKEPSRSVEIKPNNRSQDVLKETIDLTPKSRLKKVDDNVKKNAGLIVETQAGHGDFNANERETPKRLNCGNCLDKRFKSRSCNDSLNDYTKEHVRNERRPAELDATKGENVSSCDSPVTVNRFTDMSRENSFYGSDTETAKKSGSKLNVTAPSFYPKAPTSSQVYIPGKTNRGGLDRTPRWYLQRSLTPFSRSGELHCLGFPHKPMSWPQRGSRSYHHIIDDSFGDYVRRRDFWQTEKQKQCFKSNSNSTESEKHIVRSKNIDVPKMEVFECTTEPRLEGGCEKTSISDVGITDTNEK